MPIDNSGEGSGGWWPWMGDLWEEFAVFRILLIIFSIYLAGYLQIGLVYVTLVGFIWVNHHYMALQREQDDLANKFVKLEKQPELLKHLVKKIPAWVTFPDWEKVNWFNSAIEILWPYLKKAIEDSIRESVNPVLESHRPGFLKKLAIEVVDLGNIPLRVHCAKAYTIDQVSEQVIIDLRCVLGGPDTAIIIGVASSLVSLAAKFSGIRIEGLLRITLCDLQPVLPTFNNVKVTFIEKPKLNYHLEAVKVPLSAIPGLIPWLTKAIVDGLDASLIYPNEMHIPGWIDCLPWEQAERERRIKELASKKNPTGFLRVTVIEAKNLKNRDLYGKSDPVCQVWVETVRQFSQLHNPLLRHGEQVISRSQTYNEHSTDKRKSLREKLGFSSSAKSSPVRRNSEHNSTEIKPVTEWTPTVKKVTKKRVNTLNPRWQETFDFMVFGKKDTILHVKVENFNLSRTNDDLGEVSIPMEEIRDNTIQADWYELLNTESGSVHLRLEYRPILASTPTRIESNQIMEESLTDGTEGVISASNTLLGLEKSVEGKVKGESANVVSEEALEKQRVSIYENSQTSKEKKLPMVARAIKRITHKKEKRTLKEVPEPGTSNQGVLSVKVIGARDLVAKDSNGSSDPYCRLRLDVGTGVQPIYKTTIKEKQLSPAWNEVFQWHQISMAQRLSAYSKFRLEMRDHDNWSKDEAMGHIEVPLADLGKLDGTPVTRWYPLLGVDHGEVKLTVEWSKSL